jgi:hypothetical protein
MPPSNTLPGVGITKSEFNKRYWFTSLQMVTVRNPLETDYPFTHEMRHYIVRKGETEDYVGPIANVYLSHMASIVAQNKDELALTSDPNYMASAYDALIVSVKNLAPEYDPTPTWQQRAIAAAAATPPWMQQQQPQPQQDASTPPWQQPPAPQEQAPLPAPNMERSTEVAQTVAPPQYTPPPVQAPAPEEPKEETKEFELEGVKYKSTTTKNGGTMFFRDGKPTSAAEYSKAASML